MERNWIFVFVALTQHCDSALCGWLGSSKTPSSHACHIQPLPNPLYRCPKVSFLLFIPGKGSLPPTWRVSVGSSWSPSQCDPRFDEMSFTAGVCSSYEQRRAVLWCYRNEQEHQNMSLYRFEGDSLEKERLVIVCITNRKVKHLNLSIRQETVWCFILTCEWHGI